MPSMLAFERELPKKRKRTSNMNNARRWRNCRRAGLAPDNRRVLGSEPWASIVRIVITSCMGLALSAVEPGTILSQDDVTSDFDKYATRFLMRHDLVIEGVTEEVTAKQVQSVSGRCIWVSEIRIRPTRTIWGSTRGPSVGLLSLSLPEDFMKEKSKFEGLPKCAAARISHEVPPPTPGTKGLYSVSGSAAPLSITFIALNVPTLASVKSGFFRAGSPAAR